MERQSIDSRLRISLNDLLQVYRGHEYSDTVQSFGKFVETRKRHNLTMNSVLNGLLLRKIGGQWSRYARALEHE